MNVVSEVEEFVTRYLFGDVFWQMNAVANPLGRFLDWVVTSDCDNIYVYESRSPLSKVDQPHPPLEVTIDVIEYRPFATETPKKAFNFKQTNFIALNENLGAVDFTQLSNVDLDTALDAFYTTMYEAFELHVPTFSYIPSKHPPWHNKQLANLKNRKNRAHEKFMQCKSQANYDNFCALRSEYDATQKHFYDMYIAEIQADIITNPKQFWSYVNLKRKSNGLPHTMSWRDKSATGPRDISKLFAEFFASNYTSGTQPSELRPFATHQSERAHTIEPLRQAVVHDALLKLDTTKGCGPDNISPLVLKHCADVLADPLTTLVNESVRKGKLPERWKQSYPYVTPIFKSGARVNIDNYRGISILPTVAKFFESLIHQQLSSALHGRLHQQQHGFTPHRSCTTNLLQFTDYVYSAFERKDQVDVLFADFSKAFDRVPHNILIRKLRTFGFDDTSLAWFADYLTNRRQFVRIGTHDSQSFSVPSGVPQGSYVGPRLFILFMDDVYDAPHICRYLMFADDLKMFGRANNENGSMRLQQ